MVGWQCLNINPTVQRKSIVFNFQFELISSASKDVFIKLLLNIYVIKTLDKSNKIVMWIAKSAQCPLHNMSILNFGKTFNFHNIVFLRCLNYPNELSVPKNSPGNVKKIYNQKWKCQFLRFLHINTFLWKLWFELQVQSTWII